MFGRVWVRNVAGKTALVRYIDYGNEDNVPRQALRQLPDRCWNQRPLAVPCHACSFSPLNPRESCRTCCCFYNAHTHTHTTVLRPFFRDHPGEPVPEENFWTLWCKGRLTEADTPTIRLGATPSECPPPPSTHVFYRPDALPANQPTASKH